MKKEFLAKVSIITGILLCLIALSKVIIRARSESNAEDKYATIRNEYTSISESVSLDLKKRFGENEDKITENSEQSQWYDLINVDLLKLKSINPDIVSWIFFENEDISYPVLYSGDNEKYLDTDYEGNKSISGALFIEEKNNPYLLDSHTLIYGHNMRNLSMFGKLRFYKTKKDYWKSHKYFQLITSGAKFRYKVIACKDVYSDDDIYHVIQKNESADYANFITQNILTGSYINSNYVYETDDELITLSTCSNFNKRFVVTAVKVDSHYE